MEVDEGLNKCDQISEARNIFSYIKSLETELDIITTSNFLDNNTDSLSEYSNDNLDNEIKEAFLPLNQYSHYESQIIGLHSSNILNILFDVSDTETILEGEDRVSSSSIEKVLDFEKVANSTNSPQPNSPIRTPKSAAPTPRVNIDERVKGDASSWSTGPLLTPEGVKASYAGLYDTLLQSSNYNSIFVQEFVVRPDIPLINIMNSVAQAAKSTRLVFSKRQLSQGIISDPQSSLSKEHNNKTTTTPSTGSNTSDIEKDWDIVDVQVCISKQLKQRVILCQFLRKHRIVTPNKEVSSPRILKIIKALQTTLSSSE